MFEQGISKANKVNNTFFIVAIQKWQAHVKWKAFEDADEVSP